MGRLRTKPDTFTNLPVFDQSINYLSQARWLGVVNSIEVMAEPQGIIIEKLPNYWQGRLERDNVRAMRNGPIKPHTRGFTRAFSSTLTLLIFTQLFETYDLLDPVTTMLEGRLHKSMGISELRCVARCFQTARLNICYNFYWIVWTSMDLEHDRKQMQYAPDACLPQSSVHSNIIFITIACSKQECILIQPDPL